MIKEIKFECLQYHLCCNICLTITCCLKFLLSLWGEMKLYLVNSNKRWCAVCFKYMLSQNRVITYGDARTQLDIIKKGDLILLYHNDNRIIAIGFVVEDHEKHFYSDIAEHEHWINVNWIWKSVFSDYNFLC